MAQDVVLTDAKPLKENSLQERLTLFAELDGEEQFYRTPRAKMLALGSETEVAAALRWMLRPEPPCSPDRIIAYLRALAVTHPMQELSEAEASLKFRIFCEDLGHIPERIIAEACRSYRRDPANTFFTTPGKMLAICEPMLKSQALRRQGAERMLRTLENPPPEPSTFRGPLSVPQEKIVALSDARKAEIEAILNRFRTKPEAEREPSKPSEQEIVDATGALSPERRAVLRKMAADLRERANA